MSGLFWKIVIITLVVNGLYAWIGNQVPQIRSEPPVEEKISLEGEITPAKLMAIGEKIVQGKGQCTLCHVFAQGETPTRAPNLYGVAERAKQRIQESNYKGEAKTAEEYLYESMTHPSAYVVEGFGKQDNPQESPMPPINKPPIGLSEAEIVAVIAWLQGKEGGEITVKPPAEAPKEPEPTATAATSGEPLAPEAMIAQFGCIACHSFDQPVTLVGPSLWDVGARRDAAYIRQKLLDPNALPVDNFPAGVMKPTLEAAGFYKKMTLEDLNNLVAFLESKKGGQ
jgi:cytochrome c2